MAQPLHLRHDAVLPHETKTVLVPSDFLSVDAEIGLVVIELVGSLVRKQHFHPVFQPVFQCINQHGRDQKRQGIAVELILKVDGKQRGGKHGDDSGKAEKHVLDEKAVFDFVGF